jgi:hypothetical protein
MQHTNTGRTSLPDLRNYCMANLFVSKGGAALYGIWLPKHFGPLLPNKLALPQLAQMDGRRSQDTTMVDERLDVL